MLKFPLDSTVAIIEFFASLWLGRRDFFGGMVMDKVSPITFVDVETTGLTREDRVVSLGLLHYADERMLSAGEHVVDYMHLVFNPGRKSHPIARGVHGYADDELALQDTFALHRDDLRRFFEHSGKIVAHNASFDSRFVANEFRLSGIELPSKKYFCTMLAHRKKYGSRSGLDAVLQQMGRNPRGKVHGALQDAMHAMDIYCWLNDLSSVAALSEVPSRPLNYREHGAPAAISNTADQPAPPFASLSADLVRKLSPMATVMMAIARCDGEFSRAEVEAISIFIEARRETLGIHIDGDQFLDVLSALCDLDTGADALQRACNQIVNSPLDRDELALWVRQITVADGEGSQSERQVIMQITDGVRRARAG